MASDRARARTEGLPSTQTPSRIGWSSAHSRRGRTHLRRDPLRVYTSRAVVIDVLAILAGVVAGFVLRWLIPGATISDPTYWLFMAVVFVSWIVVLVFRGAYDTRILGVGGEEFKRVIGGTAAVFAAVAIATFVFKLDLSRGFVVIAFGVGITALLLGRFFLRVWLRHERRFGNYLHKTLVIGTGDARDEVTDMLDQDPILGFAVSGLVDEPEELDELDTWLNELMARIDLEDVDTVAIAGSPVVGPELVRRLAWRLEGPRIDLLVAPVLGDVAGPRVTMRLGGDVPLIHLDEPHLTGPKRAIKRMIDIVFGALFLLISLPIQLVAGIAVAVSSKGPVFYRQERVGRGGNLISVLKFRTMYVGADQLRDKVIGDPDSGIIDRYKDDPRITPVGKVLRRWSIDEMPQFWNVVVGNMSLVGPRPVLIEELALLDDADHRRHLTKPGLTGLWQVSGRKEVEWEDRMRLDLNYVENWSPALDFVIVVRTLKAVVLGDGAY